MKLCLLFFSPTNTTKKIVGTVGKIFFEKLLCETRIIDLTPLAARLRTYSFAEDDIVIFGAPVWGGRVPALVAEAVRGMHGCGARAVALSVYGNREYDDALLETRDLLEGAGFSVCAAGAFIGEHSYTDRVGTRRPDAEDLIAASTFGLAAFEKVKAGIPVRKRIRGNVPYKPLGPFMLSPKTAPAADAKKCIRCGACISVCPVCNIASDLSDLGRCVACAACVKFCPQGARAFTDGGVLAAREKLEKNCVARKQPEFFI